MKRILIFLTVLFFMINVKSQTVTPRALNGFYVKIQLNQGQQINTKQVILYPKTYPTNWFFGHVKTGIVMNGDRLNWDNVITFTFTYELFYDYYEYWNWFFPFDLNASPTITTDWLDVSDEATDLLVIIPQQIALTFVQMLNNNNPGMNFDISQVQVLDFYNP